MKTVDMHLHLLNPNVKFDRLFDRVAIALFGRKFGLDSEKMKTDPYGAYIDALISSIRDSEYIVKGALLPVDSKFDRDGTEIHRDATVCSHSEDVLALYREFPEYIIPFMSVNPNRKDALELIERYYREGAVGMKFLQNYWEVDLSEERLIPYYQKLAELGIPLIIHIGSEYTISSSPQYESARMLTLPLECGVRVIAAHVGAGDIGEKLRFWRNLSGDPKYFNREYLDLMEMMERYDNLYADISALLTVFKARVLRDLSQRGLEERLLFSTDYPVVYSTLFTSYDLPWRKRWELSKIANPLDRYTRAILEYFPKSSPVYTNYRKVLQLA